MPSQDALELIGGTPLLRVKRLDTGPCELYLKLESQNPGGSIKDRIGRSMIDDESDLLLAATDAPARFRDPVRDVMSRRLETVSVRTPISRLLPMFEQGLVPVVVDGDEFIGLLTRIDLLNYLRRRL